ncbi:MAG TPA: alpha/beta hydrolase [Deltaproteobacteria bacterium]|nr:alpha/beta hydrolase [Deltaproteobacteria bacterium]HPP80006.1 alpha/beta hydrolase [Deltaproteobacteria bacterium]
MENTGKEIVPKVLRQDIGDAELSYLLYDVDGRPMIMLHATGFLPWLWHPIARGLTDTWRVYAPYICDHRVSDPQEGGLSWLTVAEDLVRFVRELGIHRPALVGHSMGATVAAIACGAFGLDALGLVLFEPIFLPEEIYQTPMSVDQHPLASRAIRRKDTWADEAEARSYLRSKPLFRNWTDEMLDLYVEYGMRRLDAGGLVLACSPVREASIFMGGLRFDPWGVIPKVTCPVLVLEGEKSENRAFIDLQQATRSFPQGTYRLVEGAGHLIPQEKPGESLEIVRTFFESLE